MGNAHPGSQFSSTRVDVVGAPLILSFLTCGKSLADDLSFGVAEGIVDVGLGDLSPWPGSPGGHRQVL